MEQFVGLDVSQEPTQLCIMSSDGKTVGRENALRRHTMMWRVHPDHGENAETGKDKTVAANRVVAWSSPNNHLMSA